METESTSDSEGGEIGGEQPKSQIEDEFSEEEEELDDLDVKTANSLEDAIKELASMDGYENVYVEIPDLKIDQIIIPNNLVHDNAKTYWSNWLEEAELSEESVFGEVDKRFAEFKRSAQKEVNYLVKEFECRKAADSYARATTARTGILDCSKLHTLSLIHI